MPCHSSPVDSLMSLIVAACCRSGPHTIDGLMVTPSQCGCSTSINCQRAFSASVLLAAHVSSGCVQKFVASTRTAVLCSRTRVATQCLALVNARRVPVGLGKAPLFSTFSCVHLPVGLCHIVVYNRRTRACNDHALHLRTRPASAVVPSPKCRLPHLIL